MNTNTIIKHTILFAIILFGLLVLYYFGALHGITVNEAKVNITAAITQNTIVAGISAVSIVLPLTIGILAFALRDNLELPEPLFFACILFALSLLVALWNLFRFPGIANVLNVANDVPTMICLMLQFFTFLYGVVYLILGAWKLFNSKHE